MNPHVVNDSAISNSAVIVVCEEGKSLVPYYLWTDSLNVYHRHLPALKGYHYFTTVPALKNQVRQFKNQAIAPGLYCFTVSDYATFVYKKSCHIYIKLQFLFLLKVLWCVRHPLTSMIHWKCSLRSTHPRACQISSNRPDWTQSGSGICI